MTVREVLVFDGDDTLWFVEPLYDDARSTARLVVEDHGLDGSRWETLQREFDVRNVSRLGLSPKRFPTSCVEAYRAIAHASAAAVTPELEGEIWRAAAEVFERTAQLAPGAREVLTELRKSSPLALLTKGDRVVQEKRVADSRLSEFFSSISIVPDKDASAFVDVLKSAGGIPKTSWSIGNSVPSDINPALAIGMSAIWVDAHVWEHERREEDLLDGRVIEVTSLEQVPAALQHSRSAA